MIIRRKLPKQTPRVETGPTKFGDDWTGVFIRGDNAFFFADALRSAAEKSALSGFEKYALSNLCRLLESSNEHTNDFDD